MMALHGECQASAARVELGEVRSPSNHREVPEIRHAASGPIGHIKY